jgi:hypothetical protein
MVSCCKRNDAFTPEVEERIGTDHERPNRLVRERGESGVDLCIYSSGEYQSSLSNLARCLLYVFQLDIGVRVIWIQQHGDHVGVGNEFA